MRFVERLWYGERDSLMGARAALWPLSRLYAAAMTARNRLYAAGLLPVQRPSVPVISVGNLTVGGTGKTPFAAWLAGTLLDRARPAIALRGYGDDEAEVHARLNPGVPVIVNPDRGAAIREAVSRGSDVVILDDAFQHRRVDRTADVVLVSVEQLLRPRRVLPAGPWREDLRGARRADLLVLTRKTADTSQVERARRIVEHVAPGVPTAVVQFEPSALISAQDTRVLPLGRLRDANVLAFAAIGEPDLFRRQLQLLGARVRMIAFRDHHAFTDNEVAELARSVPRGGLAVCTLKDAVKLAKRWPGNSPLWYVSQNLAVNQGAEELSRLLERVLEARAHAAITAG